MAGSERGRTVWHDVMNDSGLEPREDREGKYKCSLTSANGPGHSPSDIPGEKWQGKMRFSTENARFLGSPEI
jgi:hypothetical protein